MTTDGRQDDRTTATYGHHQALLHATRPAAAAFAESILGKYFVAPVIRHGPSLVLRMLQTAGMAGGPGTGKEVSTALHAATNAPARPAVRLAAGVDRQSVMPSHRALAAWMPDLSRPEPVYTPRLLVQRKPLVGAPAPLAPAAMSAVAACTLGVPLTMSQATATAIALPGANRAKMPADITTTVADPRHVTATAFGSTTPQRILASSAATTHGAPPSMPDPAAGRLPTPTASPVSRTGTPPYAASRLASGLLRQVSVAGGHRLVQRKSLALPSLGTPVDAAIGLSLGGQSFGVKPSAAAPEHKYPAASPFGPGSELSFDPGPPGEPDPAVSRAPTPTASPGAGTGTPAHAVSRPGSSLFRQVSMPGGHRLVQRKSLALPSLGTPVAAAIGWSFGVKPAAAAPQNNHPGALAITAAPISDGTRQSTSMLPLTISAVGGGVLPDGRTTPDRWQPARAPTTLRQVLDRPLAAGLERGHGAGETLQAPKMTYLVDVQTTAQPAAGARPMAAELTLRTSIAEVNPLPTLVAATLGATTPTPTAPATHQDLSSSQGSKGFVNFPLTLGVRRCRSSSSRTAFSASSSGA